VSVLPGRRMALVRALLGRRMALVGALLGRFMLVRHGPVV